VLDTSIQTGVLLAMVSRPISLKLAIFILLSGLIVSGSVFAQSDVPRQTVAVTYPLDETVSLRFRGTTLLPRLKGEAKVKRAGRRGTRVELHIDDLPRA